MKASENRYGHRKFKKYSKKLNAGERMEELNKFACGVQDLEESSMDLKGLFITWARDYRFCWD